MVLRDEPELRLDVCASHARVSRRQAATTLHAEIGWVVREMPLVEPETIVADSVRPLIPAALLADGLPDWSHPEPTTGPERSARDDLRPRRVF